MSDELRLRPLGVIRTPFPDKASAPRQPRAAEGVEGTIELERGHNYEDALADLEGWERIWVIFWFHLNESWRPKVLPPRSEKKRGVFSTRAPHRPNPLGLSVLRLDSIEGLSLKVRDVDLIDGTPILDIKPYIPWTDAIPRSATGWLAPLGAVSAEGRPLDSGPRYEVHHDAMAEAQYAFLEARGVSLRGSIEQVLCIGPQPHAYRRIKREGSHLLLAVKDFRVEFTVDGAEVRVHRVRSGYRPNELAKRAPEVHRDLERTFRAER